MILKLNDYLDRYLVDKTYAITIKNNTIHIMNYIEIEDFTNTKVIIRYEKGKTTIIGNNLVLSKMLQDELIIEGKIKTVEV